VNAWTTRRYLRRVNTNRLILPCLRWGFCIYSLAIDCGFRAGFRTSPQPAQAQAQRAQNTSFAAAGTYQVAAYASWRDAHPGRPAVELAAGGYPSPDFAPGGGESS